MGTELQQSPNAAAAELALVTGDLNRLSPEQRLSFYKNVCESLQLNPLTQPFEYLQLNGKLKLYARKDCTDQLRKRDKISVTITNREVIEGVYTVTARAKTPDGREDEEIGAVVVANLKGEALANAMMKASTKAKRRVTLSICGLGILDETEVETIHGAVKVEDAHQPQLPPPEKSEQPKPRPSVQQEADNLQAASEEWRTKINGLADPSDFDATAKEINAIGDKALRKEVAGWLRAKAGKVGLAWDGDLKRHVYKGAA